MVQPTRPSANNFVKNARKIYNPWGFAKGYNFVLYVIFAGAMTGFILARLEYLNIDGVFCKPSSGAGGGALPGECYWYTTHLRHRVGIIIHLACILPAGLLAVLQFTPAIRHRFILYHRIAGYVAVALAVISASAALMIADRAFGGDLVAQTFVGWLGIISVAALGMAIYNIRMKQVEQHRAWMLRAWFWMASIISMRIIMFIQASIISAPSYTAGNALYADFPCPQLLWTMAQYNKTLAALPSEEQAAFLGAQYPTCLGQADNLMAVAPVRADMNGNGAVEVAAAFHITSGIAGVLAWILHAIGVEIYLKLTTRETERLRVVSYHKQLEAGIRNPGNAGLVPEKFGDMEPWVLPAEREVKAKAEDRADSESSVRRTA